MKDKGPSQSPSITDKNLDLNFLSQLFQETCVTMKLDHLRNSIRRRFSLRVKNLNNRTTLNRLDEMALAMKNQRYFFTLISFKERTGPLLQSDGQPAFQRNDLQTDTISIPFPSYGMNSSKAMHHLVFLYGNL